MKNISLRLISMLAVLIPLDASAYFRGGGRIGYGGGYRVAARTTVWPNGGVTHSSTVAGGRYHYAAARSGYVYTPGLAYGVTPGQVRRVARRTAQRTSARVAYRTAAGYTYYYGMPAAVLPSSSCYAVYWEGMTAYNCSNIMYIYDSGQYYPIEGE